MATVAELEKAQADATTASTTTNPVTSNTSAQANAINQMYDAQQANQLSQLETAYNQSKTAQQTAADKIPETYQTQANDLAVQYERNRRNFNEAAASTGVNTGTGSQANLAYNSNYGRDYSNIKTAQADAQQEAAQSLADLETNYQSQVQQALATNDYNRAAALLDEYNNQYSRDLQQAQTLASYGDFSMYATLYGEDQAARMEAAWKAENPLLAYNTGRISAEEYRSMTGSYPAGFTPVTAASSGSGGYSGYSSSGSGSYTYTAPDGTTGTLTADQVKQFQSENGLTVDGILGPLTQAAMDAKYTAATSGTTTSSTGSTSSGSSYGTSSGSAYDDSSVPASVRNATTTKTTTQTVTPGSTNIFTQGVRNSTNATGSSKVTTTNSSTRKAM